MKLLSVPMIAKEEAMNNRVYVNAVSFADMVRLNNFRWHINGNIPDITNEKRAPNKDMI